MIGSWLFSELFTIIKPIYKAGSLGKYFLYQLFNLPIGVTIFIVTLAGLCFLFLFTFLETLFGKKFGGSRDL
ncbi:MAG: hypothetical protein DRG59_00080 [Deltaproteobacteria bacterium]|nr:MAG: hypothetical protein DRG83_15025 [Deltaproteobacteria bacterium]RLB10221.1 MAG: hypothetical protein DRG59_00080 [Deltaproteobacteria bacterium]